MHGKLSKKYLDKFPENRSNEDVLIPPAGTVFSPGEDSVGRMPWGGLQGELPSQHYSDEDSVLLRQMEVHSPAGARNTLWP